MKCSQNSWYNDLERNPEKVIKVMFVGIEDGTGREVYRGIETQRYYLREVYANQRFAKWYLCGERRVPEDGREPRPNLIFQLGDQTEKVVYDDWNGVAAYHAIQESFIVDLGVISNKINELIAAVNELRENHE